MSPRRGHPPGTRAPERHSHDLFLDQVRWINRVKLDVEEVHGTRITGNQLVQLAIDLIRDDYEHRRDRSLLIRMACFRSCVLNVFSMNRMVSKVET